MAARVYFGMLVAVALGLAAGIAVAQKPDADRLAAAKEMMQAAGVDKQFEQVMPILITQLSQSFVAVAPDKAEEIRSVFTELGKRFANRKSALIDQIAELYAEKLSSDDMKAVTHFYQSPPGAKFIAAQPDIMRQAIMLGQRWGQELGREIDEEARKELKKRGIDL